GMPLAVELAAGWVRTLTCGEIAAELEKSLDFLSASARDLPARHRSMRAVFDHSWALLTPPEQRALARLSVFRGGFAREATEQVAGASLQMLSALSAKSLARRSGEGRYDLHELIRQYAAMYLQADPAQEADARQQHYAFYLNLAEASDLHLKTSAQLQWLRRLEQEHDNLRAALEWSQSAEGSGEICLRLASTLGLFWEARGYFSEGRERLSGILLTERAQGRTAARAHILARAAELAYRQSDYPATVSFASESLSISREIGDKQGIASVLIKLGNAATEGGDYATASGYLEEALSIWRELKDRHGTARALISLGWAALRPGDNLLAKRRLEEALAISRELGDTRSIGFELSGLGEVALRQGDYSLATRLLEESLELRRQVGNKWGVGVSLGTLGWVAMREGDWQRAIARLGESLEVRREIGDKGGSAWCLERLAEIALAQEKVEKAVRLFGAAGALRLSIGSVIDPVDQPEYESKRLSMLEKLGEQRFAAAWDEGEALTMEEAVAYALES
ncbi:MAG: ATP-binding protein, partial [Omnitrophica WOR_2 bacterium]